MDFKEALIKTSNVMKNKDFPIETQRIYLDAIMKYLKFLLYLKYR